MMALLLAFFTLLSALFAASASPFSRPMKKVTIVGGTHGNEYTGVWCIKAIEKQREIYNSMKAECGSTEDETTTIFDKFTSLDISTLLANPVAHTNNKRFMDVDLNREFSIDKLQRVPTDEDGNEVARAREIDALLGPKSATGDNANADHCLTIIIPEDDALMAAAAAYALYKCQEIYGEGEAKCLMLPTNRASGKELPSVARHGITIEVGPTPQGVLRHDVVEKTETAIHALLEFLHLLNAELEQNDTDNAAFQVLGLLKTIYPGGIVPCYRSAPAVKPGELSGKISWPSDGTNPNFPALMVHKSVQDNDFVPIRVGDPLFVKLDGTIVTYDGSHGEEIYLMFVNEGGYYYASSGTGIGVAIKSQYNWQTGK